MLQWGRESVQGHFLSIGHSVCCIVGNGRVRKIAGGIFIILKLVCPKLPVHFSFAGLRVSGNVSKEGEAMTTSRRRVVYLLKLFHLSIKCVVK